jgi:hypothetical protein
VISRGAAILQVPPGATEASLTRISVSKRVQARRQGPFNLVP